MSLEILKTSVLDKGSGTTVKRVSLPFGIEFVKKDFDLTGSEDLTLQDLQNYQSLTFKMVKFLDESRDDVVTWYFEGKVRRWKVNPIYYVGKEKNLFTINPCITGTSFDKLIKEHPQGSLVREELSRMARLFRFEFPHERIDIISLNVTLTDKEVVITNIRERIKPLQNPLKIFRRRQV